MTPRMMFRVVGPRMATTLLVDDAARGVLFIDPMPSVIRIGCIHVAAIHLAFDIGYFTCHFLLAVPFNGRHLHRLLAQVSVVFNNPWFHDFGGLK